MSYYAVLDDDAETSADVATVSGWCDFRRWVESIEGEYDQLRHLVEYGWSQELADLESQLAEAIKAGNPNADNGDVGQGLLKLVADRKNAQAIFVTDGCGVEEADADPAP